MKKFLSILFAVLLIIQLTSVGYAEIPANSSNVNGKVVGGWLRLRSGPGTSYQTIASLPVNSVVHIQSTTGDWCKVTTSNGSNGYMNRYYLNITSEPLNTPSASSGSGGYTATVYSYNGGNVRLRSGPSYSYGVIGSYSVGTSLYVITHGSNWDYVQIGSQYGYMKNEFIRVGNVTPQPPAQSYIAYVTSQNGLGVRLRANPNSNASILGLYSVGTQVTVLKHNYRSGWDYIQIGSRTGYMMNRFLTKDPTQVPPPVQPGNVLTDFILTTVIPQPGDTVRVVNLIPNNAIVGYRWKLGGNIIGTEDRIVIPAEANGKTMTIEVYGKNTFSGLVTKNIYVGNNPLTSVLTDVTLNRTTASIGDTVSVIGLLPPTATVNYSWEFDGSVFSNVNSILVPAAAAGKNIKLRVVGTGSFTGTVEKIVAINAVAPPPPIVTTYSISLSGTPEYSAEFQNTIRVDIDRVPFEMDNGHKAASFQWYRDDVLIHTDAKHLVSELDKGKTIKCVATITGYNDVVVTAEASVHIAP